VRRTLAGLLPLAVAAGVVVGAAGCGVELPGLSSETSASSSAGPAPVVAPTPTADPGPAPAPPCTLTGAAGHDRRCVARVIDRGAAYVAAHLGDMDATSLALPDYLDRRWGLTALRGAHALALQDPTAGTPANPFVRLVDPHVLPAERMVRASTGGELFLAEMLSCDARPIGPALVSVFRQALEQGGSAATHALWGLKFAAELGCRLPAGITVDAAARTVAAELRRSTTVDDLSAQQATYLALLGHGADVPADWVRRAVAGQLADGSWKHDGPDLPPQQEDWHTTALVVWSLLLLTRPDAPDPGMIR
jgi:hypothetical protein